MEETRGAKSEQIYLLSLIFFRVNYKLVTQIPCQENVQFKARPADCRQTLPCALVNAKYSIFLFNYQIRKYYRDDAKLTFYMKDVCEKRNIEIGALVQILYSNPQLQTVCDNNFEQNRFGEFARNQYFC